VDERDRLAERFEAHRGQLRAVAYRMVGSAGEAEDAVQETWLRLDRVGADDVENVGGWLHTVVTRICVDMLRSRASRREDPTDLRMLESAAGFPLEANHPEEEALLANAVSRALLVVLETLTPAERIAFVLHDMFAVPFEQIAPMLERTPVATKKLASRARRKIRGTPVVPPIELARRRRVVDAFLAGARAGDLDAVLAVLDPDVVRRVDPVAVPMGAQAVLRGARAVAEGTVLLAARSRFAEPALVDGRVGAVVAPGGRLLLALTFVIADDRIVEYEVIADAVRLARLRLAVLN
jgi:RNA polymerase sigma-70 factor (ECF subfamily)